MKTKVFLILGDFINVILLYFLVISVVSVVDTGKEITITRYEYLAIGVLLVVFYFVREYLTHIILFTLANAGAFAAALALAPTLGAKVRIGIVAGVFLIFNYWYWVNGRGSSAIDIHWALVGVLMAVSIAGAYRHTDMLVVRSFYLTVAFVALQALKEILLNAYELANTHQLTNDMPVREIYRNSFVFAGIIIALCVVVMVFINTDKLVNVLSGFAEYILLILLYLVKKLLVFDKKRPQEVTPDELPRLRNSIETQNPGILDQILNVIEALIVVFVLVLIIIGIVKAVRTFFREYVHRERNVRRGTVFKKNNEVREKISRNDKASSTGSAFRRTNYEKVRYMYKKKMVSFIKKGKPVLETATPWENATAVSRNNGPDIGNMTGIYEKIRYGCNEVSNEEVAAMKESIRHI